MLSSVLATSEFCCCGAFEEALLGLAFKFKLSFGKKPQTGIGHFRIIQLTLVLSDLRELHSGNQVPDNPPTELFSGQVLLHIMICVIKTG